jgi:uncharacterized protein YicC (UPF0701 family)
MTDKEQAEHYEKLLRQILQPLNEIPFDLFVKAISNKQIIAINETSKEDKALLKNLQTVIKNAIVEINKVGINTKRPNEAGNEAEKFLKTALEKSVLNVQPLSQSAGYPDVLILDSFQRPTYLEVKTYNSTSADSSFRSFFVSPPKRKSKIEFDARHLVVSFQLERRNELFYAQKASVYDIKFLMGEVKREFNTNNKQLYSSRYSKHLFAVVK